MITLPLLAAVAACVAVPGDRILAGDLAAAIPAFSALPADQPLGYAPAPGLRRSFGKRELELLASRNGIRAEPADGICVERRAEPLDRGRLLAALRATLAREPIEGSGQIALEIVDFSRYPVPAGELEFTRQGLAAQRGNANGTLLWRGRVRTAGGRSHPVWARVKLSERGTRVVANENLAAGTPVEASQVRVEEAELFPFSERPASAIDQVVGRAPRRSIRANSPVFPSALAAPKQVERGETVSVEVLSGAAQLRFEARAESAGSAGEVIAVRNPVNGRRFQARVEADRKVTVNANTDMETAGAPGAGLGRGSRR